MIVARQIITTGGLIMARPRGRNGPIITYADIARKKSEGMTQSEIAREVGVSRAYISQIVKEYGPAKEPTPREKAIEENYPWEVATGHTQAYLHRQLRNHLDYVVNGSEGMSEVNLERLRLFYNKLKDFDLVVEYSPLNPPMPDTPTGGYAYLHREKNDGDLIIRINDYTIVTPKTLEIWRMPETLP